MIYLDSSVIVSMAVGNNKIAKAAWIHLKSAKQLVSSEISVVECQAGVSSQLANRVAGTSPLAEQNLNRILAGLHLLSIGSHVLGHARALVKQYRISVGLRSMDAIHLATANILQQAETSRKTGARVLFLTSDRKQFEAFSAEGHIGHLLN